MDSTYSNFRMDRTQNLNVTRSKETSKDNYKTSKSYHIMPSFQSTGNSIFNTRSKDLFMNQ